MDQKKKNKITKIIASADHILKKTFTFKGLKKAQTEVKYLKVNLNL